MKEECYNSRKKLKIQGKNPKLKDKKLNLRGANFPPVAPSDVKKMPALERPETREEQI